MEKIVIPHCRFGDVCWHVVGKDNIGNKILWANLFGFKMPFYDPQKHREQRFLRIDWSGRSPVLYETETKESVSKQGIDSQRWTDLNQYGSNQWAVSDVRTYLNGEFLHGFPQEFQDSVVPYTHEVLLTQTNTQKNHAGKTQTKRFMSAEGVEVYDDFSKNGIRYTYSVLTDRIFLPTRELLSDDLRIVCEDVPDSYNYWLMEPYLVSGNTPYLVRCMSVARDINGVQKAYVSSCNAAFENVYVFPMCLIPADRS